jgi:CBS domain-containing protein
MQVSQIMTPNPRTCTPDSSITDVAGLMVECDCGAIPVCEDGKVVGIVTDRDITCRLAAKSLDPSKFKARDCMTSPVLTAPEHATLTECFKAMEQRKIRRIVVVDREGRCVGMVSQADIARNAPLQETGEVVKVVSKA